MDLDEAIGHALDGRALLFAGAGFAQCAVNVDGNTLPTGNELASILAKAAGMPESGHGLDLIAEAAERKLGSLKLTEILQSTFTVLSIAEWQKAYGLCPWHRIYTTNYDTVLELSLQANGRRTQSLSLGNDPSALRRSATHCVHLNGSIDQLTPRTLRAEFKLTNTSYLSFLFGESTWGRLFRQDLQAARSIFFVGYSLYDLDISRVLYEDHSIHQKCFFVTRPNPDEMDLYTLQRFGSIVDIGAEALACKIRDIASTHVRTEQALYLTCFRGAYHSPPATAVRDRDVIDLCFTGK
ncbi:MAG: SIR2 family protein [Rhodospirillales bacterium]|nr:SIR2 family protein [Rhodospirillales bacterium]